ncbi:uncharacterized protein M6B38_206385 [Iris pallida]|uniref:Uncharacterized protein n=1 Tax=Iris pallida TaxID=29817 RepID=A0AAX6E6I1_IRIPA|nr:uncharacterized protein M6B38_206385 [Iris pallida]
MPNDSADGNLGGFDMLTDGMDDKLKRAATTGFDAGSDESLDGDYMVRPDITFIPGSDYSPEVRIKFSFLRVRKRREEKRRKKARVLNWFLLY